MSLKIMTKAFFNPGPVYITDHDFAKSERERERVFFIYLQA